MNHKKSSLPQFGNKSAENLKQSELIQAVLKWTQETQNPPTGLAVNVPTRQHKYIADIAAFWSHLKRNPEKTGLNSINLPKKTMIVECRTTVEQCWPNITNSQDFLTTKQTLKTELQTLIKEIKKNEPHLKTDGNLFDEYADWDLENTANKHYHHLKTKVEQVENAIHHGSYFEQLHRSEIADQLYLAVPAEMISKNEVTEGWGLLWVYNDLTVKEIVKPTAENCSVNHRMHLIQNIATVATKAVLFSQGIFTTKEKQTKIIPKPKRRRPKKR